MNSRTLEYSRTCEHPACNEQAVCWFKRLLMDSDDDGLIVWIAKCSKHGLADLSANPIYSVDEMELIMVHES